MISRLDAAESAYLGVDTGTLNLSIAKVVPVRGERSGALCSFSSVLAYNAAVVGG